MSRIAGLSLLWKESSSKVVLTLDRSYSGNDLILLQERFENHLSAYILEKPLIVWEGKNSAQAVALFMACVHKNLCLHVTSKVGFQQNQSYLNSMSLLIFRENDPLPQWIPATTPQRRSLEAGLLLTSSGTTNGQKFCHLPLRMLESNVQAAHKIIPWHQQSRVVIWSSFTSTAGWNTLLLPAMTLGIPVTLEPEFNAFSVMKYLSSAEDTIFHFSPHQALLCFKSRTWSSMETAVSHFAIVGSSDIYPRITREFCEKNITVMHNYGLTEAGPYVFSKIILPHEGQNLKGESLPLGHVAPGIEYLLTPFQDNPSLFKLHVRGASTFGGYLEAPERDGSEWLDTGDIVEKKNGELYFCGREYSVFDIDDHLVFPQKIEQEVMEQYSTITDCQASYWSAPKPVLTIEYSGSPQNTVNFVHFLRTSLGFSQHMDIFVFHRQKIQRNVMGKLLRPGAGHELNH